MSHHVSRYRPGYFVGFEEPDDEREVETVAELLALPFVQSWRDHHLADFYQFSVSSPSATEIQTREAQKGQPYWRPLSSHLMCELNEGRNWWVVAMLDADASWTGLPAWVPHEADATP